MRPIPHHSHRAASPLQAQPQTGGRGQTPRTSFLDDYSEGCHPRILNALAETNLVQQTAYGDDAYSAEAKALIAAHLANPDAAIHFVASGTLANIIAISSSLRPHEAVIAAASGHIVVRETGAIEATGHKIITLPSADGKLTPADIRSALRDNAHFPHMARPRLVYVSNATEMGTVYAKAELEALSAICKASGLLLFVDGARLSAALSARINDLTLKDIAALADIFWIGGTKAGALFGEAIVICNPALNRDFGFHIKQRGALLAKGRALGIQFRELFRDDLFFSATKHANRMAGKLADGLRDKGCDLAAETESNQVFAILPDPAIEDLRKSFDFYVWEQRDAGRSVIRLVTSWATEEANVDAFLDRLGDAARL